jgi:hypothetical protein
MMTSYFTSSSSSDEMEGVVALDALIENFDILINDYDMNSFDISPPTSTYTFSLYNPNQNQIPLEEVLESSTAQSQLSTDESVIEVTRKKRKILASEFKISKQSKADQQLIPILPSIIDPVEQLMKVPWYLFGAFNSGNSNSLGHLTDTLFHDKCVLRWERPVFSLEKVGSTTMKQFFDACLKTVPDGVIMIRQINHHHSIKNHLEVLKCKLTYTGTVFYEHFIEEFQGFKSPSNTSVEYMDSSKLSPAQIDQLRQSELLMRQQGQKIQVFGKMTVKFFVDPYSRKIVGYEERFKLESFAGVDMNRALLQVVSAL